MIVVNAEKTLVTGRKAEQKYYHSHSGYHGGAKDVPYAMKVKLAPESIVVHAVRGMLPKNRLGRKLLRKLRVYRGPNHPHKAQDPESLTL